MPIYAANGVHINELFFPLATVNGVQGGDILLGRITDITTQIGIDGDYAYRRPGKTSRYSPRKGILPLVYPEGDEFLSPLGRDFCWNMSNPLCCTRMPTADVPWRFRPRLGSTKVPS